MLARIANNLFWMSRYLERAEFLARYIEVQYADSLDASLQYVKTLAVDSILRMNGSTEGYYEKYPKLKIKDAIDYTVFDTHNPSSVKSDIHYARDNAMVVREKLSFESWEAINSFYLDTQKLTQRKFSVNRYYEIYQFVTGNCYKVKGIIDNTALRDPALAFIRAGKYLECAIQICRIILTKLEDWEKLQSLYPDNPYESFNWACLLKSACGFDMSRRLYKSYPNLQNTLEFLLLNEQFPNSVIYNVTRFVRQLNTLRPDTTRGSYAFFAQKVANGVKFTTTEEVLKDPDGYFSQLLAQLYDLAAGFEENYLSY